MAAWPVACAEWNSQRRDGTVSTTLLIVDDLGMCKLAATAADDSLEIVMHRYERASTMLTQSADRGLGQAPYYNIDARMPVGTTTDQIHTMLQNLLVEPFKMTIHRETRETDAYRLIIANGGSKLKEVEPAKGNVVLPPSPPTQRDADGWMIAPRRAGVFVDNRSDRSRWTFQQSRGTDLATALERRLGQPVTYATSLRGNYDFMLTFSAEALPALIDPLGFPVTPPVGVVRAGID
jgi:uncharacterized protein (TIGR03435 family)